LVKENHRDMSRTQSWPDNQIKEIYCENDLTLTGLEPPVRLVDDVDAAAPAHHLIIAVTLAQ